jgi:hypothetical protein
MVLELDNEVIIQRDDKWDPLRKKYFHPRFAIVLQGQKIKWINDDIRIHRLVCIFILLMIKKTLNY